MIMTVFGELIPFLILFFMLVWLFTIFIYVMGGEASPQHPADYAHLGSFLPILIQTFRNSIGDIAPWGYGPWDPTKNKVNVDKMDSSDPEINVH